MRKLKRVAGWVMALGMLAEHAAAQSVIDRYRAEIDASDRVNSSGVTLTRPGQILTQDRANNHRFGRTQPGDTSDTVFLDQAARRRLPSLLARGTLSREAKRAITLGQNEVVEVTIYGQGRTPTHLSVDLATTTASAPEDQPLGGGEFLREARRIQSALNARGFDAGPVDGNPGERTRRAIAAYQTSISVPATGDLTRAQFIALTTIPPEAGTTQQAVTIASPSFDCAKAGTTTEEVICAHPDLAALDLALSQAWTAEVARVGSKAALPPQITWLARRDACLGDIACLDRSMRDRIAVLGGVAPGVQAADGRKAPMASATIAPAISSDVDNPASAITGSKEGLILVDGRPVWGRMLSYLALPEGGPDLETHETEMAHGLHRAARLTATDDLQTALIALPSLEYLQRFYDYSRLETQAEVARLGIDLSKMPGQYQTHCENRPIGKQYDCATQYLETEFDRRRFVEGAAAIIARDFQAGAFDMPMDVTMFCPLGRIDDAYDFDTGRVQWARMIQAGSCQANIEPFSGFGKVTAVDGFDLANGIPESTEMPADQVEILAQRHQTDPSGIGIETHMMPLMLAFPAKISITRNGEAGNDPFGMAPLRVALTREGPVSLRWSGAPAEIILTFAAANETAPAEAVDLWNPSAVYPLVQQAPELDASALSAALRGNDDDTTASTLVRIPAWPDTDETGQEFLHSSNFMASEEPAQRVAQLAGIGLERVGWTQLQSRESGVPDTELVLVFPRPLEEFRSGALDSESVNLDQARYYLLATMATPMRMSGSQGAAMVAAVHPIGFEIQAPGVGNAMRLVARPSLAEVETADRTTVFVPSPYWYAAKGAELSGTDIATHMDTIFNSANLAAGDTFARLDAIRQAASIAEQDLTQNAGKSPWIVGRISLAPYDLAQSGWPVRQIQIAMPSRDNREKTFGQHVRPDIQTSGLILPMPEDVARRVSESFLGSNSQLPFRAKIDLAPSQSENQIRLQGFLREVMLLPPQGSPSMPVQVSASFTPGEELATVILPEQTPSEPSPATPTSMTEAVKLAAAESAQPPVSSGDGPQDGPWPQMSDIAVADGAWDLVGLRTGMSLPDAHAAILARGGVLAALERKYEEVPPIYVQATRYQRLYILGDGREALTLAAPNPDGPVLVVMRRILIPRGDLPFADIRSSLLEKYGQPVRGGAPQDNLAPMIWSSNSSDEQNAACNRHQMDNWRASQWQPIEGMSAPDIDIRQSPSAWQKGIYDYPADYLEQMAGCGQLLQYAAEDAASYGASAFTLTVLDTPSILTIDQALAGISETSAMKIEF